MENYIVLLLLIVPGYIAQLVNSVFSDRNNLKSKFEETIDALIFSIFILLGNYIVISLFRKLYSLNELWLKFSTTTFVIKYIFLTVFMSVFIGCIWTIIYPKIEKRIINNIRVKFLHKNEITFATTTWTLAFDDGKQHAVYIEKDGKEYAKGFIKHIRRIGDKTKEIYLEGEDIIENNKNLFEEYKGIYLEFNSGIKIREYDLKKYNDKIKELLG